MNDQTQQLERIVAYLDGELSAEESAQVEQQLAADEAFRQELQGAERAWSALDELPMAQVGDDFSRTTMELVVSAAHQDVQARSIALPVQQRRRRTTTALFATMALLLGALAFRVLWNNPNRRLLADLPVIQNVDIYSQFHSVDFLRQLHRLLNEHLETSSSDASFLQAKSKEFRLVSADEGREDWLAMLPDDEKIVLRAKLNCFRDLSSQRQAEMRRVHQQIDSADDREQLLETMFRYQQWLSELAPSKQYELRDLAAAERVRRVTKEMIDAASAQEFALTSEQLEALFRQVRPHIEQLVRQTRSADGQEFSELSRQQRRELRSPSTPEQVRRFLQYVVRESPEKLKAFSDAIVEALPDEMGQAFQKLSPRQKVDRLRDWAWQFRLQTDSRHRSGKGRRPGEVSEQELADFFVELDSAEKERLLALSRDKMKQQLTRMLLGKMRQRGPYARGDRPLPPGPPRPEGRHGRPRFEGERDRPPRNFQHDRRPRRRSPEESVPRD